MSRSDLSTRKMSVENKVDDCNDSKNSVFESPEFIIPSSISAAGATKNSTTATWEDGDIEASTSRATNPISGTPVTPNTSNSFETPKEVLPLLKSSRAGTGQDTHSKSTASVGTGLTGSPVTPANITARSSKLKSDSRRRKSIGELSRVPSNIYTFSCKDIFGFEFYCLFLVVLTSIGIASIPLPPDATGFSTLAIDDLAFWYLMLFIAHAVPVATLMLFSVVPYHRESESLPWKQTMAAGTIAGFTAILTQDVLLRLLDEYNFPFLIPATGSTYCTIAALWLIWKQNWKLLDRDYLQCSGDFDWLLVMERRESLHVDNEIWNRSPFKKPTVLNLNHWPPLFRRRCLTMFLLIVSGFTYYLVGAGFIIIFVEFAEQSIIAQIATSFGFTIIGAFYRDIIVTAIFQYGRVGHWPQFCGCFNNACTKHSKRISAIEETCQEGRSDAEKKKHAAKKIRLLERLQKKSDSRLKKDYEILYFYWYEFSSELFIFYVTPSVENSGVYSIMLFGELLTHLYPTLFWTIKCFAPYVPGTPEFNRKFRKILQKYWYRGRRRSSVEGASFRDSDTLTDVSTRDLTSEREYQGSQEILEYAGNSNENNGTKGSTDKDSKKSAYRVEDIARCHKQNESPRNPTSEQLDYGSEGLAQSPSNCNENSDANDNSENGPRKWAYRVDDIPPNHKNNISHDVESGNARPIQKPEIAPWKVCKIRRFFLSTTSQFHSVFVFLTTFTLFAFGNNSSKYPFDFDRETYTRSMLFAAITGVIYLVVLLAGEFWIRHKNGRTSVLAVSLNYICYSHRTKVFLCVNSVTTVVLYISYFAATYHSYRIVAPERYP